MKVPAAFAAAVASCCAAGAWAGTSSASVLPTRSGAPHPAASAKAAGYLRAANKEAPPGRAHDGTRKGPL
jgi:hypothetical protein